MRKTNSSINASGAGVVGGTSSNFVSGNTNSNSNANAFDSSTGSNNSISSNNSTAAAVAKANTSVFVGNLDPRTT